MYARTSILLTLTFLACGLSACSGVKKQFDFSKRAPDEFAIETRAPLEMPKNFSSLPPPRPGAQRPQELATNDMARETIIGEDASAVPLERRTALTGGEAALLNRTGAAKASPSIRRTVDIETDRMAGESESGFNKVKRWIGADAAEPANVVDPVAEANRLKQNKAQGKPITAGKTPVLEEGQ